MMISMAMIMMISRISWQQNSLFLIAIVNHPTHPSRLGIPEPFRVAPLNMLHLHLYLHLHSFQCPGHLAVAVLIVVQNATMTLSSVQYQWQGGGSILRRDAKKSTNLLRQEKYTASHDKKRTTLLRQEKYTVYHTGYMPII